ncbi:MAG: LapA family protein [Acetobacteraceae bacterium]
MTEAAQASLQPCGLERCFSSGYLRSETMLRLLFIIIFLVILIIFALSNLDTATLKMINFDIKLPVNILVLVVGIASALFGAAMSSVDGFRQRQRARKAEQQVQTLQTQLVSLHERLGAAPDATTGTVGAT